MFQAVALSTTGQRVHRQGHRHRQLHPAGLHNMGRRLLMSFMMTFTEIAAKAREWEPIYGSEGGVMGTNRDMVLVGALCETLAVFEYNVAQCLSDLAINGHAHDISAALKQLRVPPPREALS
jgi:hypothetical protein